MKVAELVSVTPAQIECRVNEFFRTHPGVGRSPPIRLEAILLRTPNVVFELEPDLLFKYGVEGGIWKEPMSPDLTVFVDYDIYAEGTWADYNAVLGEEIAHLHLDQGLFLQVKSIEDFLELQGHPDWDRFEGDAKDYSLALRMPAGLFVAHAESIYRQVIDEHSFGDAAKVEMHVRTELCKRFYVSRDDARRRMMDFACNLSARISTSVNEMSRTMVPCELSMTARQPIFQKLFWDQPIA
jgi:hypothetical protein